MENWWCDFSNSYFEMFTTYIWHIVFADVRCGKYTVYNAYTHICICAMYTTKLRFFCHRHEAVFHVAHFFHHIFCIDVLLSLPLSKKFACVNIKLYYCIFWLCLVATLYFYNLFPSTFTHHCCCWPYKQLLVSVFFFSRSFIRHSKWFSTPTTLNACLLHKFWMEFSKTSKLRENYVFQTVWNAEMIVSYAVICTT